MQVRQILQRPVRRLANIINGFSTKENRRHPRARIKWSVVLMTDDGLVDGRTQNLSQVGGFIRFSGLPKLRGDFRLVITTKDRLIPLTAELIWSDVNHLQNKSVVSGIGVRFTSISNDDRSFLRGAISQHI